MNYAIVTLGCKANQYDSASLASLMEGRGYRKVRPAEADVIIVNTCAVTGESSRKSRQAVRRAKKLNDNAVIAVCGCFSQVEPEAAASLDADIVLGSGEKHALLDEIERKLAGERDPVIRVPDISEGREFELLPGGIVDGRVRATLKIEDGCDRFCAYCVIPAARGRVRSMPLRHAVEIAKRYESEGFRELVLTGIEIASYGKDSGGDTGLADLVETIAGAAPGLRLRLGSLEPQVIDGEFAARMAATGRVCPHFHLSLQSGCDRVLRMMGRGYDTRGFYEAVGTLRSFFPGCAVTADIITGFPGETEQDHARTLEFIRKCRFSAMHVFPYSKRPGTRAAGMPGALPREVKAERAGQAAEIASRMRREYMNSQIGKTLEVLFETGGGPWRGHSENYLPVEAPGDNLRGVVKKVKILSAEREILVGALFDK